MEKISKHKSKFAAIALVLLMASIMLTLYTPVQGQDEYENMQEGGSIPLPAGVTPDYTVDTVAFFSFVPNPVGLGQTFLVNMWTEPTIHICRYLSDYTVTITDPDGNEDVIKMDTYRGDSTAWFEYIADKVGTWKLKFDFPGGYFPAGNYTIYGGAWTGSQRITSFSESCYYKPSSDGPYELVVQEEPVLSWPQSPLPTDYWTRPVYGENREWWPILGHYPATGVVGRGANWPADTNRYMSDYDFIPYVQAPNSAHIVWKQEYIIGGLLGGEGRQVTNVLNSIGGWGYPTIIYAGRCYETYEKPGTGTTTETYWRCYDLRTGELFWERPLEPDEPTPQFVEYAMQGSEVPGATARAGLTPYLVAISGERVIKWNPYTGAIAVNMTGPPSDLSGHTLYGYPYVLSVQNLGGGNRRLINWTIENNAGDWETYAGRWEETIVNNFTQRVKSNITWPLSRLGTRTDFEAGITVQVDSLNNPATGTSLGQRLTGVSLTTGQVLWQTTIDTTFFSTSMAVADHGKFAGFLKTGETWCWDLSSGNIVWKAPITSWPWGCFGAYNAESAYGLLFQNRYDGVHAFDWETGDLVWTYLAPTPYAYETPYHMENTGVYSWHSAGMVADGKLYTVNTEHTPTQPIARGWRLHCINATTGEGIWNISTAGGVPGSRTFQGAIADGYLVHTNEYDGYMYVFGKGKSATTVTAPKTAIPLGQSVVIEGTVLDMSPAQPSTPCVSKESMAAWMEHLHMQLPIPADVTGVPVSLDTLDPNGNFVHIGDVTTDMSGTFGLMWTPEVPGTYKVMATFMGDDSYGSSYAETHVGVGEAPEPPPEPTEPAVQEDIDRAVDSLNNSIMPILYGTIVAVIVVALLVVYDIFFRKRQ